MAAAELGVSQRTLRRTLALSGTRPLPELYAAAGAHLAFDTETMAEFVGMVEEELAELNA